MDDTSVLPPPEVSDEGKRVLRDQVVRLAEQLDGFREQLRELYEQLGVVTHQDAVLCIEIMQGDIALARELSHVYTKDPQDSASIVAALLALVDSVSE